MNVRISELSEPLRGNERFIIETQTKERAVSYVWGLFKLTKYDWEVPQGTSIPVAYNNYNDAEVAAKRFKALINPTYHYL